MGEIGLFFASGPNHCMSSPPPPLWNHQRRGRKRRRLFLCPLLLLLFLGLLPCRGGGGGDISRWKRAFGTTRPRGRGRKKRRKAAFHFLHPPTDGDAASQKDRQQKQSLRPLLFLWLLLPLWIGDSTESGKGGKEEGNPPFLRYGG